jgi:hypothetical protein
LENLVGEAKTAFTKLPAKVQPEPDIDTEAAFEARRTIIENNISFFKEACGRRSAYCNIHRDRGVPAREIISESRFADVLVIDPCTSFKRQYEGAPTGFVRDILKEAECPVIISPERFTGVDELIFTYNGGKSAVFAIKQFTYLFPQLRDKKVTIVRVNGDGQWEDQDMYNFKEWLQSHYSSISFDVLKGDADSRLFSYLLQRKNIFTVMGAYGRNALSQFFRKSQADLLIKTMSQPIFISHY